MYIGLFQLILNLLQIINKFQNTHIYLIGFIQNIVSILGAFQALRTIRPYQSIQNYQHSQERL